MDWMEFVHEFGGIVVAVVVGVLGSNGYWAYRQSKEKKKSAEYRMILGLGHAEIFRVAEKYLRRGAITSSELEDLTSICLNLTQRWEAMARLKQW